MTQSSESEKTNLAQSPVQSLKGVGPKLAEKLAKLHIYSVLDLLLHLPHRYEDRTQIKPLIRVKNGERVLIKVTIEFSQIQYGKKRSLICRAYDQTTRIDFRFFYFSKSLQQKLQPGVEVYAFGEVRRFGRSCQMVHPELSYIHDNANPPLLDSLTPVYPATDGLHQASLRNLQKQALKYLSTKPIANLLPETLLAQFHLPDINQSLSWIHQPPNDAKQEQLLSNETPAVKRLIYEELLAQQLSLLLQKSKLKQQDAFVIRNSGHLKQQYLANLPFKPTEAQSRVSAEIIGDLQSSSPMLRLLQGDVGAGKTLVAALAALHAIESGFQVALMAPTEILAEQHFRTFAAWFKQLGLKTLLLISKVSAKQRKERLEMIANGEAQLIIGTHALFQNDVAYKNLGLAIIDEQHRFGVNQRLQLKQKAPSDKQLHQLMMTATPIPRTLAMTAYADMDISIIDQLPPGRTPVKTIALSEQKRQQVIERIETACRQEQRQVYWVCTLIEESEEIQSQAAETSANLLAELLPHCSIGLVHGRLKSEQKQIVMDKFKRGELDVLVATTVIEVGVDVPNASLMVIENPERLGLAQLHQLRGRVGRGSVESHCILLYSQPLSENGKARIQIMRETNDGFIIAEEDLKLRGPGEMLGTRQTGELHLRFADIIRDAALLPSIQKAAKILLNDNPKLAQKICRRWLGSRQEFADV